MAIKNTSFAKGEAVQKLIEVIARVNNKSVTDDAALQSAIDEVREMFKTDELTECTTAELNTFISGSQLEPGHKYKITDNDNIIVSAKSTSELESYAIGDAGIYEYSTVSGFSLIPEHLTKEEFNDFAYNVAEGDTYTPLQKIILETVGEGDPNLVELSEKEFRSLWQSANFVPGTVYKTDVVLLYFVGETNDVTKDINAKVAVVATAVDRISPDMILIDGDDMFAITANWPNNGSNVIEIESFADGNGNRTNFYPKLYFPSATNFSRNNIIFNKISGHISAPTDFACSATTVVGNTIISPSKFTVSATTVQANEVAIGAQVVISGAGTVGMNKFGAASNVNIACVSNGDVSHNEFGPQCAVIGTSLQVFQLNKVGAGSTGIQFSVTAAGNEIAGNCNDIKIAIGQRNKFGVQCGNISLNGTTYGCSGNEFANGCGAEGAITLADGCGGNTFGIQCCNCTLNANVVGCEFEGFNSVTMAAGLQNYSVKRSVGYGNGPQNITLYKGYTDGSFRINVSRDTKGNLIYWTDDEPLAAKTDEFIGTNTVTTVANIPVTKSTVVATVAAGGAVSFAEGLADGREVYVIAQNSGTDPITLTFTDTNVESVELAAGARAEFSVINIAGTYYTHVGVDSAAAAVEEISAEEVAAKFA